MSRKAKFDDIQIKNGALEQEGKKIAAHLQKVREYEAAAKKKASHELKKADEHFVSLTQELATVKAKCRGAAFKVFKEKYCPDLSRSRIYQLLEIGTGKKTLEQSRAEKRDSASKSRAAKKSESTTSTSVVDNGEACENRKAELKALRELGASETERKAFITSLNGVAAEDSPEASAEKRKAEYAAAEQGTEAEITETADTGAEKREAARRSHPRGASTDLKCFLNACYHFRPALSGDELLKAREHFEKCFKERSTYLQEAEQRATTKAKVAA